jgi:acyl dehydratase
MMRLSVEARRREEALGMGSPGADSCRWLKPVRPGDTLTLRRDVLDTWPSRSRPLGFVRTRAELVNQHGDVVVSLVGVGMFRRRAGETA